MVSNSDKRVVLITGASSGIGYATAVAFARAGVNVAAMARRVERLYKLQAVTRDLPGEILPLAADVRDAKKLAEAVGATMDHFGRLDILVANAGVGQRDAIVEAEWDHLETLLRTNIDGVLHSVRAAVPAMKLGGRGGHIILISSITFNMTMPYAASYAASKAFISSLARSLRLELEVDHIYVTDLRLGRTKTEFNEKRLGKPGRTSSRYVGSMRVEKVANAIVEATNHRPKIAVLRPIDRLVMLANRLVPGIIGRMVIKQYR